MFEMMTVMHNHESCQSPCKVNLSVSQVSLSVRAGLDLWHHSISNGNVFAVLQVFEMTQTNTFSLMYNKYLTRYIIYCHESRCQEGTKEFQITLGYTFVSVQPELKMQLVKSVKVAH